MFLVKLGITLMANNFFLDSINGGDNNGKTLSSVMLWQSILKN